jgi:hypothetical protein
MNDQIRKLAIKAGIDIRGHLTGVLIVDEKPDVQDLEKFAELIIRDVVATVKRTQPIHPDLEWVILNNYDLDLDLEE